ncbi:MAPEG family protein [Lentisphaera profundi]|uniref:MAPEG family protein n=1 Tax=Lentisphaera profundi TaxID=1658616 RepID=A0ABY7VY27_9BACT|nr:MAPEG family protein [Lentisphaera profundi]WDE98987.1 MAPEG family protein [Lentisphaera profundi]
MTIGYSSILIYLLISYAFVAYAKFARAGYDNQQPRIYLNSLSGKAQRAHWAHQNSLEAMAPFCAGVIIAHLVGLNQVYLDTAALTFCGLRLLYGYFYIQNLSKLRSLAWALALILNIYLLSGGFWS